MLIDKDTQKVGDVITFRITTGEEIIGEIVAETESELVIKKPLTIVNAGQHGVSFGPTTMLGDPEGNIRYKQSHIVAIMKTRDQAATAYKQHATGIALAGAAGAENLRTK